MPMLGFMDNNLPTPQPQEETHFLHKSTQTSKPYTYEIASVQEEVSSYFVPSPGIGWQLP